MKKIKAKPCPFCGGEMWLARLEGRPILYEPRCRGCGASVGGFETDKKALEFWNKRTGSDYLNFLQEQHELRAAMDEFAEAKRREHRAVEKFKQLGEWAGSETKEYLALSVERASAWMASEVLYDLWTKIDPRTESEGLSKRDGACAPLSLNEVDSAAAGGNGQGLEVPLLSTLTERLRGVYRLGVNDGAGLLDGSDTFTREFQTPSIQHEAASRIEALEAELAVMREATLVSNLQWKAATVPYPVAEDDGELIELSRGSSA